MIINFRPIIDNFIAADGSFKGITAFLNYPDFALIEAIKEIVTGNLSTEILGANSNATSLEVSISGSFFSFFAYLTPVTGISLIIP